MRPEGSTAIHVPWLDHLGPAATASSSVRLSTRSLRAVRHRAAVLSVPGRAGSRPGASSSPSRRLDLELRGPDGASLGVLAQLRDLLPGRYAFGLTGRDAEGETLEPGRYRCELTAYPDGPKRRRAGVGRLHHSLNRTRSYTRRRAFVTLCSENKERLRDHRRGPRLPSPREPVRAGAGAARGASATSSRSTRT